MAEYMKSLRNLVGKRPLLQCGASVIVYKGKKVLLQKRKDNGFWGYMGGSVELGENTMDAAKRELFEESGLIAKNLRLFDVFSGEEFYYKYPNGDEVYNVDIVYLCCDFEGEIIKETDETADVKWFDMDNLPALEY